MNPSRALAVHKYGQSERGKASQKRYRARPEIKRRHAIANRNRLNKRNAGHKILAFQLLGDKCAKCGFSDVRALQIDHINGDGVTERKQLRSIGIRRKISMTGVTTGYQLLCANCNWIKRAENNEAPGAPRKYN